MHQQVQIAIGSLTFEGYLQVPEGAQGIILFINDQGGNRFSSKQSYIANILAQEKMAALVMDLLTDSEVARSHFNVELLTYRALKMIEWVEQMPSIQHLPIGLLGANTGAAAALEAASNSQSAIKTIVSRGGRPDLASDSLSKIKAPSLFIVGQLDEVVIELNRMALSLLEGKKRLEIIPHASQQFDEPASLEKVGQILKDWFKTHLVS